MLLVCVDPGTFSHSVQYPLLPAEMTIDCLYGKHYKTSEVTDRSQIANFLRFLTIGEPSGEGGGFEVSKLIGQQPAKN